jgi:autotransporter-associated beta strand protein
MVVSGNNTYSGGADIQAGELNVQSNAALGTGPATAETGAALEVRAPGATPLTVPNPLTLNGSGVGGTGALRSVTGSNSWSGAVTLATDTVIEVDAGSLNLAGPVNGPGGLTRTGAGPLTLSGTAADTYAGPTTVNAGSLLLGKGPGIVAVPHDLIIGTGTSPAGAPPTVILSNNEQIADSARVTVAADGTLNVNGFFETIGSLAGGGQVLLTSPSGSSGPGAAGTLATGADNASTTFSGTIGGAGGNLTKVGAGVFVLQADNTYSGTTTVNGGTLRVEGSQPASAAVVNAGGTLGGHGTVGPTTANPGGTVSPGDSPGILSVQGGVLFHPGSALAVEIDGPAAGTGYGQLSVAGPVTLDGPALRLAFGFSPSRGQDFVLIANHGSGPVRGTFAGIPEDALLAHAAAFFDLSYAGGRGGDVDILGLSRGDLFVRALFADFGASSSRTARAPFEEQVQAGTSRLVAARHFLTSAARRAAEVDAFYAALGQPPDGRQGVYVAQLLRGVPPGQVLIGFLTSRSFGRHHRSNAAFLQALFTGLHGHPPRRGSQLGHHTLGSYLQELNAGTLSRAGLARELLSSDEVYTAAVVQNFETFLGVRPTRAQLGALLGQLPSGVLNPDTLSESILARDAYIDFFITRAGANKAPGIVLVNV